MRSAPAAAVSTTPPITPSSTASPSMGRQRRRSSARKVSQSDSIIRSADAVAAGTRAAVQPGPTAIRLASTRVAGMASSTSGDRHVGLIGHPGRPGEHHPGPASGQHAQRQADEQRGRGQGGRLPAHDAQQLGPDQAQGLEQGQVTAAAADPGQQGMAERADRQHAEERAEDQRGVADAGVMLDVAGPLVGGDQAEAPRAAGPGDRGFQAARGGGQVGARLVAEQEEVVTRRGPGAAGRIGLGQHGGGDRGPRPQIRGAAAAHG